MPVPHGPRHHPIRRSWSANIPLTERSAHRDGERLGGEIEMQSYVKRKATDRGGALGIAACVSLILSGCGGAPEVTLPVDKIESAALGYGATMALAQDKVGKGSAPIDDAGHALHFALLGGSPGGLGDPAKFAQIAARGATLQHKFVTDKNAASYTGPCAKAFPRSEEHTSELQSLMRRSYAVFCLKQKTSLTELIDIETMTETQYI